MSSSADGYLVKMKSSVLAAMAPLALSVAARPQGTPTDSGVPGEVTYTVSIATPLPSSTNFFSIDQLPGVDYQLLWSDFHISDFCFNCPLRPSSYVNAVFGKDPSWSIYYNGSNTYDFTPFSFAAGCSANQTYTPQPNATGAAATPGFRPQPIPCRIILIGFYTDGTVSTPPNGFEFTYHPDISYDMNLDGSGYPSAPLETFNFDPENDLSDLSLLKFSSQVMEGYEDKVIGDFETQFSVAKYVIKNLTITS